MTALPITARDFAIAAHGDQLYGDKPYSTHLQAVVEVLMDFGAWCPDTLAAGWLHDAVEDTPVTRADIERDFGPAVASMVWACTGIGETRRERNRAIYAKVADCPAAARIKMADRIANVEQAERGSKHHALYRSEAEEFYDGVARYAPREMWNRLWLALSPR